MSSTSVISISSSSGDNALDLYAATVRTRTFREELVPQHPEEIDLDTLSYDELLILANTVKAYSLFDLETCREKLLNLRGFVRTSNFPHLHVGKAFKAIKALRARMLLLDRQQHASQHHAVSNTHTSVMYTDLT
jgi:hypothetical protein